MLRQRPESLRNLILALAVALVSGVLVDAGCSKGDGKCGIKCSGVSDGLADLIKEQYDNMQDRCPILDSLVVEGSSFPDKTLTPGWLPAEVPLNGSLIFTDCDFTTIDDEAFQGNQFLGVTSLHLIDLVKLRSLRRAHFRSLKELDTLVMRYLVDIEHVEDGLLADNAKLSTLQFSNEAKNSVAQFLANITGNDNVLPNLQTVDLGNNNLGRLEPQFFTSFAGSMLAQLYLNAANVTEIAPGTIPVTSNLVKLDLRENQMITLKADFSTGRNFSEGALIYLERNPWLCSCDLVWMLNMSNIHDDPTCVFPGTTQNISIRNSTEEKICGDGSHTTVSTASTGSSSSLTSPVPTSTTTEVTTETTTETTIETTVETTTMTEMPPNVTEECHDGGPSSFFSDEEDTSCVYEEDGRGTLIQISECANGNKVHVRLNDSVDDMTHFVWSNTTQTYNGTCLRYGNASSKSFYVTGLKASESFIICAVSTAYDVNIGHCGAYTMQPVVEQRPWIKNGDKNPSIIGAVVGVVFVALLSGFATALAIKKKPTLLGSNVDNVTFTDVNNKRRRAFMVIPRDYRPTTDLPPELPPRPSTTEVVTSPSRPSQASSDQSTVSYISVPTARLSEISARLRLGNSPRASDASSTSYLSIIEGAWSGTVRGLRRLTGSISDASSDTVYERRDSDIPYVTLGPDPFLPTAVDPGSRLCAHNGPLVTERRQILDAETIYTLHTLSPKPHFVDTEKKMSGTVRTNTLRALKKTRKAQELVQKQLHMFDYVVLDETTEDDLPNETSDDCVLDVSPVVEDIRRGLVLSSCGIPTTASPGGSRDGVTFQPEGDDEVSGCLARSSELRRDLEDAIVLESLEKGGGAASAVVQRNENPDVEERALFRPSGIWNQALDTWPTTVPTIRLQKPSETDTDCDC